MEKLSRREAGKLGAEKSKITWQSKHKQNVEQYLQNPKLCVFCNEIISFHKRRNKFCTHSCAVKLSNSQRHKVSWKQCPRCSLGIPKRKKFCSHKCRYEFEHQQWIEKWLLGEKDGSVFHGMEVSSHIRQWLKEKFGEKCIECGWNKCNKYTGLIPLQLDHINGNGLDNRPENIRLLCPSCHSLTPNYGALNKGNGRLFRRKIEKYEI